jgi:DNA mismatch repair ATPase MutS
MTPLAHISSQINVPDSTGHESLFQAELYRCKSSLDTLMALEGKPSLIVMDEIFSSTNPVEAISGAYAVCEKIAGYGNNMLVFTTHLNYLTNLKKGGKFTNYKMDTVVDGEDFTFTYRLVKGVNKHYLALEILKKNGFDAGIVERALEIKRKFV